jgi:hypothetical protein
MVQLTIPNGLPININLNQIFKVQRKGSRTILLARIHSTIVEFEVLEPYDVVAKLHGTLRQ